MASMTRRSLLKGSAVAAAVGALAGCSTGDGTTDTPKAPSESDYPISPDADGVKAKWSSEQVARSWTRVTNEGGPALGIADESKIIQVDGLAFKDLNGNGKLDFWEDWRQDPEARAAALAREMDLADIPGLMVIDGTLSGMTSGTITDEGKAVLDKGVRGLQLGNTEEFKGSALFSNAANAYVESQGNGIPCDFASDPRNSGWGIGVSPYPDNLALAASFTPELAAEAYKELALEYRALGVTTLLGPQTDVAVEPRWGRNTAAFGADPALSRDMMSAATNALQSTFDENGEDQGWGVDSVNAMMKHFPGDGAAQGGREAHDATGQFNVYPKGMFEAGLVPFIDGALQLDGKTKASSAAMTSYSVAWSEDEEYGELVGTAFSKYKVGILRNDYGYDGVICTDWQVLEDEGKCWGVEKLTPEERVEKALEAGVDQFGGGSMIDTVARGIDLYRKSAGEDVANDQIRQSARRLLENRFNLGLFENPYLDPAHAEEVVMGQDTTEAGYRMQQKTIVMLKNDGAIRKADATAKPKVYVPLVYTKGVMGFVGQNFSSADLPVDEKILSEYFDLVTDSVGEPTGEPGEDGKPTLQYSDIVRATPEQLADCNYALVFTRTTQNTTFFSITGGFNMFTQEYVPLSMQYRPYVADGAYVSEVSAAGRLMEDGTRENQSYFGKMALVDNETDLDMIEWAQQNMPQGKPVIVAVNSKGKSPIAGQVMGEFEAASDAILYGFNVDDRAFLDIAAGRTEPSALLPIQLPANMDAVEKQASDAPRDMECYIDSVGNSYDFGFGLNWSGVIKDERTERYCVNPLTKPETPKVS